MTTITAPQGQALAELEVEITGLEPNEHSDSGRFYWHTYDFHLVGCVWASRCP